MSKSSTDLSKAQPLIAQEELETLEGAARALCEAPKSTFDIEREERQRKQEAKRAKKSRKYKKTEGPSVIVIISYFFNHNVNFFEIKGISLTFGLLFFAMLDHFPRFFKIVWLK